MPGFQGSHSMKENRPQPLPAASTGWGGLSGGRWEGVSVLRVSILGQTRGGQEGANVISTEEDPGAWREKGGQVSNSGTPHLHSLPARPRAV